MVVIVSPFTCSGAAYWGVQNFFPRTSFEQSELNLTAVEEFGDAEIQNFNNPIGCHINILRFQIAMYYQVGMGKLHRTADIPKKINPLVNVQPVLVAVLVNGDTFYEFHDQVRDAIVSNAAIMELGNVWVAEIGQNLTFYSKPLYNVYLPWLKELEVITSFSKEDTTYSSTSPKNPGTVRQLLSHTSGMGYTFLHEPLQMLAEKQGDTGLLYDYTRFPLLYEPGTGWS